MKYNDFKGKKISRLGFGTMRLPLGADGKIDYEQGQAMVDYAIENGINYFDTAYMYHEGRAEVFTGKALAKHPRESFCLADKLPTWLCHTEEDVMKIFEKQFQKCGVDYFDFYLLHSIDEDSWPDIPRLRMAEQLLPFVNAENGRIRHLGASVHCKLPLLKEILEKYGDILEFIQIQLNYFDWEFDDAKELYDLCAAWGKPVVVMEPLRGGMLANPMSDEAKDILDAANSKGEKGAYASYGFRFVNELESVMCTLSGMSTLEQLKENIEIFSGEPLTSGEHAAINEAVKKLKSDILVPCTGCNYCFECPSEIKIPELFKMYNEAAAKGFNWLWGSLSQQYNEFTPNAKACIGCGSCESHCPQKINIIQRLKDIDAKYAQLEAEGK